METISICPDAIRVPVEYAGEGDSRSKLLKLSTTFSRILNVKQIVVRLQGNEHFISTKPDATLNHVNGVTGPGVPRYSWENRGDGVLYGYLKPNE